jgi:hypothetical protein
MSLFRSFCSLRWPRYLIGVLAILCFSWSVGVHPVQATINQQISYQGKLFDTSGLPVVDATYSMTFSLYTSSTGGTPIWTAAGTTASPSSIGVTVSHGLFTVMLGDVASGQNALTGIDWSGPYLYLGVTIAPDTGEMTPRKRLGAVPQAFNSEQLQGMYASSTIASGSLFVINQVGTGAASSQRTALEVRSSGSSAANDYLIRAVNNQGADVFSINTTGSTTSTAMNVRKNGKFTAFIDSSSGMSPVTSTSIGTLSGVRDFKVHGRYGYIISNGRNLDIVDLSGVSGVGSIARIASPSFNKIEVVGSTIYAVGTATFYIIDASVPTSPVVRSSVNYSGGATAVAIAVRGSTVFVVYDTSIKIIDVSDPYRPRLLSTYSAVTKLSGAFIQGTLLYVADRDANVVRILDIHDPTSISQVGSASVTTPRMTIVQNSLLVVNRQVTASIDQLVFFDVSNPSTPVSLGTYNVGRAILYQPILRGRYFYQSVYDSTLARYEVDILDVATPSNVIQVQNFVPAGSGGVVDVAGTSLFVPYSGGIDIYSLGQLETTGVKTQSADIASLLVRDQSVFEGFSNFTSGVGISGGINADRMTVSASGTQPTLIAINTASTTATSAWAAYMNTLLVGGSATATGTANYRMVLGYNAESDATQFQGICIDDLSTAKTCPTSYGGGGSVGLIAEGSVTGGGYDLAERYLVAPGATAGDLLVFDPSTSTQMMRSPGVPYDSRLSGIVSTRPGLILGIDDGTIVALAGRVPTRVSTINGSIAIGDPLTSSIYPGVAMKATQPGRVVGYALEAATATSTIEVFVHPGYEASSLLANDGTNATVNNALVVNAERSATADTQTANSWGLTFRGQAWNGSQSEARDYVLGTQVFSTTSSQWSVRQASSTLFVVDQSGNTQIKGDLFLGGKLFPSARGAMQDSKYIFLDNQDTSSTYMATNADGWQSNDSYDFAERYYSPDALTPGDLVVVSQQGRFHVQRSFNATAIPMGIVSTRPGFVAGAPATSTYPIALAGRVPTKVSSMNGAIKIGDLLAPSTIPGVAVKATVAGPVVGQALESFSETNVGSIEVFVHAGWWGGPTIRETATVTPTSTETESTTKVYQGLARITVKGIKVHVQFPSVGSYPLVQVTPYGEVTGGWWTDHYTHEGFDILLKQSQEHEVTFAWRVEGMTPEQSSVPLSDGSIGQLDIDTGNVLLPETKPEEEVTTPEPSVSVPTTMSTESASETESAPVVETTPTTTESGPVEVPVTTPSENQSSVPGSDQSMTTTTASP